MQSAIVGGGGGGGEADADADAAARAPGAAPEAEAFEAGTDASDAASADRAEPPPPRSAAPAATTTPNNSALEYAAPKTIAPKTTTVRAATARADDAPRKLAVAPEVGARRTRPFLDNMCGAYNSVTMHIFFGSL